MAEFRVDWDSHTATTNLAKHRVSFILLGLSSRLRLLVVVHCYREADAVIRVISARKAERDERETYVARNN